MTCTPIRPSSRLATRPLLTSSSHGDFPCAEQSNVSFEPTAETTSSASYEPNAKYLIKVTNIKVKLKFFHRPSMTSTYDSAESIATPLLNRIWTMIRYGICWLHSCTYKREKQVQTDHEIVDSTPTAYTIFSCTVVAQTCLYLLSECTVTH